MNEVERAVSALERGSLVVLPTDTVYGLACLATSEQAAGDLYGLKGRPAIQPTAVVFAGLDALFRSVPGLGAEVESLARRLLPGPYTLVVPNPQRRFPWLNPDRPEAIGVRVPALPHPAAAIVKGVGAVVATSANLPGGNDPRTLAEVPERILRGAAVAVDGGELPGTPSTVIDLTGPEPVILRAGAGDPAPALARRH